MSQAEKSFDVLILLLFSGADISFRFFRRCNLSRLFEGGRIIAPGIISFLPVAVVVPFEKANLGRRSSHASSSVMTYPSDFCHVFVELVRF